MAVGRLGPQSHADATQRRSLDRKSTRLNSSHRTNSYAVSCLKKKTGHVILHPPGFPIGHDSDSNADHAKPPCRVTAATVPKRYLCDPFPHFHLPTCTLMLVLP